MSNVLKKITKKYKWLRFLNRKVTKLSVLGASLVGLCVSSGASFAKYRDENYGGGNAGVATPPLGRVIYEFQSIECPKTLVYEGNEFFCFCASFYLTFEESEVKGKYELSIRLAPILIDDFEYVNDGTFNYNSFLLGSSAAPTLYTFEDGKQINTTIETMTGGQLSYSEKSCFVGISDDEGNNYKWNFNTSFDSNGIINIDSGEVSQENKYFKILFFVKPYKNNNTWVLENSKILYDLEIEQVA